MFTYPVYQAIKAYLNNPPAPLVKPTYLGSTFLYTGQYKEGKENTSFVAPALYVELPKGSDIQFLGGKTVIAKKVEVKLHYISHAPFKNHDNTTQEAAIAAHETTLAQISKLMEGWNAFDSSSRLLTQQFITRGANLLNFSGLNIFSVLTYQTDIFSYHLKN